jgi:hypothetical protein
LCVSGGGLVNPNPNDKCERRRFAVRSRLWFEFLCFLFPEEFRKKASGIGFQFPFQFYSISECDFSENAQIYNLQIILVV